MHLSLVTPTWHVQPGVQVLLPHLVPRKKFLCIPNQKSPYLSCGTLSRLQAFSHLLVSAIPSLNLGTFSCCAHLWCGACRKAAFKPIYLDTSCSLGPPLLRCHLLLRELLSMMWCLPMLSVCLFASPILWWGPSPLCSGISTLILGVALLPSYLGMGRGRKILFDHPFWSFMYCLGSFILESLFFDHPWVTISKALGIVLFLWCQENKQQSIIHLLSYHL